MVNFLPVSNAIPSSSAPKLEITCSPHLATWLQTQLLSLAFTTYQTNRLFFIGCNDQGTIAAHERLFDKPMGLYASNNGIYLSTRYQIWRFENLLSPGERYQQSDRLYIPRQAYTTGDLNVHDVVLDDAENIVFVNTDFSCLATISNDYSFVPLWQPTFISKLAAEDRCHLNGLGLRDGKPRYVTACSTTDTAAGWRNHRVGGGVVIDVQSNEIIGTGLSMPHSPRWYQGKLWLLNAGTGDLGYLDGEQFVPITFCPGFVRGLAFWENFAFVGLSKLRSPTFSGLPLEERLTALGNTSQSGLMVIDINTGKTLHWLLFDGVVEELFDVVVLPGVRQPQCLGFQSEEIERLVTFPGSGGIVTTKPTAKRPSVGDMAPVAGLPRQLWSGNEQDEAPLSSPAHISLPPKYQRVYHITASSLADYDAFTFPSLQQRWQTQPQRGELVGISASVAGEMVAFAIAEMLPEKTAELLSLFVAPEYRQQGIATKLMQYLEKALVAEGCQQVRVVYQPTALTTMPAAGVANALVPILQKLGWQSPQTTQDGEQRSHKVLVLAAPLSNQFLFPAPPTSPKVSLVMTVYNTEAYLAEALDSMLAQTFTDWELILWDDGSTDGSVAIAQDYARRDARIHFHAGKHLGRVQALQQAHSLTRGDYVGLLDADDLLAATALQETVSFLDSHPDYGMVYTNHLIIDAQGKSQGLGHRCQIPYSPMGLLVNLMTFHFRLLRQSVFAAVGGINLELTDAEDYDLCLRVSEVTQIYHLERSLYFYRLNPQGLSQQQTTIQRQHSERAINQALQRRRLAESLRLIVDEATGDFRLQQQNQSQASLIADAARSQFEKGKQLAQQGDLPAAVGCFQAALRLQPDYIAAYNQLGNALQGLGRLEEAIATYQHIIHLNPNVAPAHCNLGATWQMQGKTEEAIAAYQRAIELKPDFALAHLNLGKLHANQQSWREAAQCLQQVVRLQPEAAAPYYELGNVLQKLGETEKAIACLDNALKRQPDFVAAWHNLGYLWMTQGDMSKAQKYFEQVITLQPDFPQVDGNLGQVLEVQGQLTAALASYNRALEFNPAATEIFYQREHLRLRLCDWEDYEQRLQTLQQRIQQHLQDENAQPLLPLSIHSFPVSLDFHQAVARHWARRVIRNIQPDKHLCTFTPPPAPAPKLRLGYISADFRQHAVSTLIHEIFQYHDRSAFEVYGYSLVDASDEFTEKIRSGCDDFVNLAQMSSAVAAQRIHADGIHILIDLAGYTTYSRPEILALQPAPIQVQYLGYPGTMGAEFIQYILADPWLIPAELAPHYSEKVIELPHAFVASPLAIAEQPLNRRDFGLPADAFVFCCFNRSDKFDPEVFATWMRILQQVPHAVLWLIETTPKVSDTLRHIAQQQGITPARLVFTPRMPLAKYLAAYPLADVFLDTFVYNAGATAIHALSAGLPIITRPGKAFAARMGASICAAAGLDLLIGDSTAAYEQKAVHLATHRDELATIRQGLQVHRHTLPLFRSQQWITQLEAALQRIWGQR
ncbi:TIGR03032 family protein [Nostoc sp. C057]|uniref:TIGR03032 family protein n=1 Tax=Nostoc sp. C057 TaxID=2576903 RepID=UPI0015C3D890|nr:TIGR03032 family protein [Nostoc sp. C057]